MGLLFSMVSLSHPLLGMKDTSEEDNKNFTSQQTAQKNYDPRLSIYAYPYDNEGKEVEKKIKETPEDLCEHLSSLGSHLPKNVIFKIMKLNKKGDNVNFEIKNKIAEEMCKEFSKDNFNYIGLIDGLVTNGEKTDVKNIETNLNNKNYAVSIVEKLKENDFYKNFSSISIDVEHFFSPEGEINIIPFHTHLTKLINEDLGLPVSIYLNTNILGNEIRPIQKK